MQLAATIAGAAEAAAAADPKARGAKGKAGGSLIGKFDLKSLMSKRPKK